MYSGITFVISVGQIISREIYFSLPNTMAAARYAIINGLENKANKGGE